MLIVQEAAWRRVIGYQAIIQFLCQLGQHYTTAILQLFEEFASNTYWKMTLLVKKMQ